MTSNMMGVKLKINVCKAKIHLPFFEVGLNRQSPLEISVEALELVVDLLEEDTEKRIHWSCECILKVLQIITDFCLT